MQKQFVWRVLVCTLMGVLIVLLGLILIFKFAPDVVRRSVLWMLGEAEIPVFGAVPSPPVINAPRGQPPAGYLALTGVKDDLNFACGFLLELEDGSRVGVGTAHASWLKQGTSAVFLTPGGDVFAELQEQIDYGQAFHYQEHFTRDYVLWSLAPGSGPQEVLKADSRGQGQPGERVRVYGRLDDGNGGSINWPGVVMKVDPEVTWIQLEDSFHLSGYSGCPVVSEHTGRVIGMVIAGRNHPPIVMGLNPVWSLVEKARIALERQ